MQPKNVVTVYQKCSPYDAKINSIVNTATQMAKRENIIFKAINIWKVR